MAGRFLAQESLPHPQAPHQGAPQPAGSPCPSPWLPHHRQGGQAFQSQSTEHRGTGAWGSRLSRLPTTGTSSYTFSQLARLQPLGLPSLSGPLPGAGPTSQSLLQPLQVPGHPKALYSRLRQLISRMRPLGLFPPRSGFGLRMAPALSPQVPQDQHILHNTPYLAGRAHRALVRSQAPPTLHITPGTRLGEQGPVSTPGRLLGK